MWIWILLAVVAAWVFVDARKRKADSPAFWTIATLFLAVIAVPGYLASRPLLPGERREGGRGWNFLRYLALTWTVLIAAMTLAYVVSVADTSAGRGSDADRAGAIGTVLGLGLIGVLWIVPTAIALLVGALLRKPNDVEIGEAAATLSPSTGVRRCPYCAEEIQVAAIVCRFCQRDLPPSAAAPPLKIPPALKGIALTDPINPPDAVPDPDEIATKSHPPDARWPWKVIGAVAAIVLVWIMIAVDAQNRTSSPGRRTATTPSASDSSASPYRLESGGTPARTEPMRSRPPVVWSRTGSGDDVFDMPTDVRRVRIIATYPGNTANFIVEITGRNVVNELLGVQWQKTRFEGTYLSRGGTVAITRASGVQWSFEEIR